MIFSSGFSFFLSPYRATQEKSQKLKCSLPPHVGKLKLQLLRVILSVNCLFQVMVYKVRGQEQSIGNGFKLRTSGYLLYFLKEKNNWTPIFSTTKPSFQLSYKLLKVKIILYLLSNFILNSFSNILIYNFTSFIHSLSDMVN